MITGILLSGAALVLGVGWAYWLSTHARRWRWWLGLQVIAAALAAAVLGQADPAWFVLDEFVGAGLVVLATRNPYLLAAGTILFGALDALKPLGISAIEQLPAVLGVVGDDVAAGLLAAGIIWVATRRSS